MGADRLIQIHDPSFDHLDPWGVSSVLAKAIGRLAPDLILCGKEALDDLGGVVGACIAEFLGLPHVSSVVHLKVMPEKRRARIHRSVVRGDREVLECPLPAVLSVERGLNRPRYPTVRGQLHALDQRIERWNAECLGLCDGDLAAMTEVIETFPPRPRLRRIPTPDSRLDGFERTLILLSRPETEKPGNIVQGEPEKLAGQIVEFLVENGIIQGSTPSRSRDRRVLDPRSRGGEG